MKSIENYLFEGLRQGYYQNQEFNVRYSDNELSIIEYLLTVNLAQKVDVWRKKENKMYSIFLEYSTNKFFRNTFLPYMLVGEGIFDIELIHPTVTQNISDNAEIRTGRIDIVICDDEIGYGDHKKSLIGIEVKGINPSHGEIFSDVNRLKLALEMNDPDNRFQNSLQVGYCLHLKLLGGNKVITNRKGLEAALEKSISNLKTALSSKYSFTRSNFEIFAKSFMIKGSEDYKSDGELEYTADEVAEGTKIVAAVIIKLQRT